MNNGNSNILPVDRGRDLFSFCLLYHCNISSQGATETQLVSFRAITIHSVHELIINVNSLQPKSRLFPVYEVFSINFLK